MEASELTSRADPARTAPASVSCRRPDSTRHFKAPNDVAQSLELDPLFFARKRDPGRGPRGGDPVDPAGVQNNPPECHATVGATKRANIASLGRLSA